MSTGECLAAVGQYIMLAGEAVLSIRGRGLDNKHDIAGSFARCAFACSLIYFYATATARWLTRCLSL